VVLYVRTDDSKAPICRQLAGQLANLDLLDNPADDRLEQPIQAEQHDWGCAT